MTEILIIAAAALWAWEFWRRTHGSRRDPGPAFVEADDVDPAKRAEVERRTADQLAGTRRTFAPPVGPNHVARFECSVAGHEWVVMKIDCLVALEKCSRCGASRPQRFFADSIRADLIKFGPPAPDPTADRHQAFSEPKPFAVTDEELCAQNGHIVGWGMRRECSRCKAPL